MKRFIALLSAFVVMFAWPVPAQTDTQSNKTPAGESIPEANYHLVVFLPSYRFVSTTGFAGRVGEYDTLNQSVGGDLAMTFLDFGHHTTVKTRANFITRDDFDINSQLRWGKYFTLSYESRSFVRHLDNSPYRADLIADDIIRTEPTPEAVLFGIKRTMNNVNARFKVPKSPLTLFVKGGWQARRGTTLTQYYSMGAYADENGPTCEGSCHSTASLRRANYTTRNIAGGVELKVSHAVFTYEHEFRSFNNRLSPTYSYFGSTIGSDEEPLPQPTTTPNTYEGYYLVNLIPSHQTQSDMLRAHVPIYHSLVLNGNVSYARSRNTFTNNPQNAFNADLSLNWNPHKRVRAMLDFHQQNLLNDFVPYERFYPLDPSLLVFPPGVSGPGYYSLFGNPSLHRNWIGLRVSYALARDLDLETYYKRTHITRSDADLWPQAYSPNNAALLTALEEAGIAGLEPWVAHLVPTTFSNTGGVVLRYHHGEWSARSGYEWVGTHAPGYLTDPGTANRVFAGASFSPLKWLTFSNDFSVLLQSNFPGIQRTNHLWANTAYVLFKPVPEYTLGVTYSYLQNNLRSDLLYRSDLEMPVYLENLVPFKALSQSVNVSSSYLFKKRLAFNVDVGHITAHSDFRPNLDPNAFPTVEPESVAAVAVGRNISMVNVPQELISSGLDYRWKNGFNSGFRFQYGRYRDVIHPEETGLLRGYTIFVGRTW